MQIFDEHVSGQPLIRDIQTWAIHVGTWGDLYGGIIHDDPFPGVGARGQSLTHFKHKYNL